MGRRDKVTVGLDIGSTKICTLIAAAGEGGLEPIGFSKVDSKGLKKGVVVNLEATVEAIRKSVGEAELKAGTEIDEVYVGLAGPHVRSFNSKGAIPIATQSREITREDVRRVIETARAVALAPDREVIHIIPQEFVVDDQDGIGDPLGMVGTRLEVNVHIVTSSVTASQNIVTAVNRSGLEVADTVLEPIAAGEATMTDDERELGCILVDIGGGKTNLAIYHHGAVRHTVVLPIGSDHFTNDIAVGLRTPIPEAERLKREYGCVMASMADEEVTFEFAGVGSRQSKVIGQRMLSDILQPRAEEIIHFVRDEIRGAGYERQAGAGVVLTGGGAVLKGVPELIEELLDLPVRLGIPQGLVGESGGDFGDPGFATVVGLVEFGERRRKTHEFHENSGSALKRMVSKLRSLV
jgi:cell division protein FtsA